MREFPKSDLLRNPCVSVWILCQTDVKGSHYSETGHQVCDTSSWQADRVTWPNPHLMLCYTVESGCHTNIWNMLPVEAKKEHFTPCEQEILLLSLLFYPIWSPPVWWWLWQKADSVPREHQCPVTAQWQHLCSVWPFPLVYWDWGFAGWCLMIFQVS